MFMSRGMWVHAHPGNFDKTNSSEIIFNSIGMVISKCSGVVLVVKSSIIASYIVLLPLATELCF